jgi:hypothetical protein
VGVYAVHAWSARQVGLEGLLEGLAMSAFFTFALPILAIATRLTYRKDAYGDVVVRCGPDRLRSFSNRGTSEYKFSGMLSVSESSSAIAFEIAPSQYQLIPKRALSPVQASRLLAWAAKGESKSSLSQAE